MTPAFGHVMLTQYIRVFDEQSEILVNMLQPEAAKGDLFDLWPFLINANIDIITGRYVIILVCTFTIVRETLLLEK